MCLIVFENFFGKMVQNRPGQQVWTAAPVLDKISVGFVEN